MFGENWALEVPLVFAEPGFEEIPTLGRSNAFPLVAEEVAAVRTAAGAYEIAQYARYEVRGAGADAWLDHLLSSRLPEVGRIRLAPMLNEAGRLMGDLSVTRLDEDRWWLTGSYYLQRVAPAVVPPAPARRRRASSKTSPTGGWGSRSRDRRRAPILDELTDEDVSNDAFPFMAVRPMRVGSSEALVGRLSLTGELGYEIVVPRERHAHAVAGAA